MTSSIGPLVISILVSIHLPSSGSSSSNSVPLSPVAKTLSRTPRNIKALPTLTRDKAPIVPTIKKVADPSPVEKVTTLRLSTNTRSNVVVSGTAAIKCKPRLLQHNKTSIDASLPHPSTKSLPLRATSFSKISRRATWSDGVAPAVGNATQISVDTQGARVPVPRVQQPKEV